LSSSRVVDDASRGRVRDTASANRSRSDSERSKIATWVAREINSNVARFFASFLPPRPAVDYVAVLDYASVIPHFFSLGYFARRKYLHDYPRAAENIVKALIDATRYVFSNPNETIEILGRHLQITDGAFLKNYYQEVLVGQLDRDLYADNKAIDMLLEQEGKTNAAARKLMREDVFDTTVLDKLRREGY